MSYDIGSVLWVAQDTFGLPSRDELNTAGIPRGRRVVPQSSCEESAAAVITAATLRHGIGCAARRSVFFVSRGWLPFSLARDGGDVR